ncbi:hypothetical protein GALLR39Z86_25500 [Glycomyces algeriensis]|uniref:Uncharacterized protein n=1 Tax=Glycomyces algeriensis TaxID=256037 RepID=A0A9W6G982_9ACTN|nr:hypothetical protein GALLR39Z86_25500 [Glycomyces algeriensis]
MLGCLPAAAGRRILAQAFKQKRLPRGRYIMKNTDAKGTAEPDRLGTVPAPPMGTAQCGAQPPLARNLV